MSRALSWFQDKAFLAQCSSQAGHCCSSQLWSQTRLMSISAAKHHQTAVLPICGGQRHTWHMSCCGIASRLLSKWQLKSARTKIQKPFTELKYHLWDRWLYLAFGKGKLLWSWHAALEMPTKDKGEGWLYFCRDRNGWYNSLVSWKPLQLAFTVHAGSGSFARAN